MSREICGTVKSSKGFYIGDICYVLGDKVYDTFWGNNYRKEPYDANRGNYEDGVFEDVMGSGYGFAVCGTGIGDGCYPDVNDHYEFAVDAGVIGVVPIELIEFDPNSDVVEDGAMDYLRIEYLGHLVKVDEPTECHIETEESEDGVGTIYRIKIGKKEYIEINTSPEEDEDYEDEEDEDEEDE